MAVITGSDLAEILVGTVENDQISSLGGDDLLHGGPGNDLLDGGIGTDLLLGGVDPTGADTFILRADLIPADLIPDEVNNLYYVDTIGDFMVTGGDTFVLPTLPDGTQVTFEMLQFELFESEGAASVTTIKVPLNEEFKGIALVDNVIPDQLISNPALFVLPT